MTPHRMGPAAPYTPVRPARTGEMIPADDAPPPVEVHRGGGLPRALAALAWEHRARLMPFTWMAATDAAAVSIHYGYAAPGLLSIACIKAVGTTLAAAVIAAAWAAWRTREGRLGQRVKLLKTRRKIRTDVARAVAAGWLWSMTAVLWTPVGPHGAMQIALLAGGVAVSAKHLYRTRQQTEPAEPVKEIEPAREDSRIALFRDEFCQAGPLMDAGLRLDRITGGFCIHIEILRATKGTYRDVQSIAEDIARAYDVPFNQVSAEPTESQSPRHALVTVLTESKAHARQQPWDGESTYDPATGTFDLGRFADTQPSHWQLHEPYSGAYGGICVGVIGSGKSGTMHVVSCEAGQAKLCIDCLTAQACAECTPRRICALFMGDPQRQPFGVWRGRADVTAWGPLSCVRMLSWLHAGLRYRADVYGRMEWTDHLERANVGKGWFDPTPRFAPELGWQGPILLGVIDEWPILATDPILGPYALDMAAEIQQEGRKVGVQLVIGETEGDVGMTGSRDLQQNLAAYNACVHRTDRIAKQQFGLDGNPVDLPRVSGTSFLRGYDQRSGIVQRTKWLPEYARHGQTGMDVRAIAERIGNDPILFDGPLLDAIVPLGFTGAGQILEEGDGWTLDMLHPADESDEQDSTAAADTPAQPVKHLVPVSPHDLSAVWRACESGPAEIYDVLERTGLDALTANRCVDRLIDDGHLRQNPDGAYAPASLTP